MRRLLLLLGVVVASSAMSARADAVCNIKGQWCGYPAWAANAFTAPGDRVPDSWLGPQSREVYNYDGPYRARPRYRHR